MTLILPWILDIGTIAFFIAAPRLLNDWWKTSGFTRQFTMTGTQENQHVMITLHSTGFYLLQKKWQRTPGVPGIIGLGEVGRFSLVDSDYRLSADNGWIRNLKQIDNGFSVEDTGVTREEFSLQGWSLECK